MKKNELYDLEVIAGPCSITYENVEEIVTGIGAIATPDKKRAIYGTRVVGLKSRTTLSADGKGMGIDYDVIKKCLEDPEIKHTELTLPSVELAEKITKETGMAIATEIMLPHIQLPFFGAKRILDNNLLIWNPAVDQLGWHVGEMSEFASKHDWDLGIKHGKFLGKDPLEVANHPDYSGETTLEKTWKGMATFVKDLSGKLVLIHRGVDVPGRGDYRNALVHEIMKRVKPTIPGAHLYFDPSHSFGPKMRHKIVEGIIDAMKLKIGDDFLYDGILIEAGTSPTDTDQHITIAELQEVVNELSTFRKLRPPKNV